MISIIFYIFSWVVCKTILELFNKQVFYYNNPVPSTIFIICSLISLIFNSGLLLSIKRPRKALLHLVILLSHHLWHQDTSVFLSLPLSLDDKEF